MFVIITYLLLWILLIIITNCVLLFSIAYKLENKPQIQDLQFRFSKLRVYLFNCIHCSKMWVCMCTRRLFLRLLWSFGIKNGGWWRPYGRWQFLPFWFWWWLKWIGGGEVISLRLHERRNTNIETSTFQKFYFLSSNRKSDIDEDQKIKEILEPYEDLLEEGVEHIIGIPTPQELSSLFFEDVFIETFLKYIYFTLQSITLMIDSIKGGYFSSFQQIYNFFISSQTSMSVPHLTTWKPIQLKGRITPSMGTPRVPSGRQPNWFVYAFFWVRVAVA